MVLTVQSCLAQIEHSLGGALSAQLDPIGIVNEAGQYLVSMHDWVWLDRPPVSLATRAEISISGSVSWQHGQNHLTKAGAFTNYTWLDGDSIVITAGTGTPYGRFPILSRVSDNAIHIGWPNLTSATITGFEAKVKTDSIAMPVDFGNAIDIQPTQGLVNSFNFTDIGFINQLRTNEVAVGNFQYWGAITRGRNYDSNGATTSGVGAWRMEIYPTVTTADPNALTMFYRAGWRVVEGDADMIAIPDYCETLFRSVLRAFARGYEEDDIASIHQRLAEIEQSVIFMHAKRRDGDMQPTMGQMSGGAVRQQEAMVEQYLKSSVLGPS